MHNYLEYYQSNIAPKLKEIDIFIQCEDDITVETTAYYLGITEAEVSQIMRELQIASLNRETFFQIMVHGSSEICKLFAREKRCGSPHVYSREDIAYIYNINIELINDTCDDLNFNKLTSYSLPDLFTNIPLNQVKVHN